MALLDFNVGFLMRRPLENAIFLEFSSDYGRLFFSAGRSLLVQRGSRQSTARLLVRLNSLWYINRPWGCSRIFHGFTSFTFQISRLIALLLVDIHFLLFIQFWWFFAVIFLFRFTLIIFIEFTKSHWLLLASYSL